MKLKAHFSESCIGRNGIANLQVPFRFVIRDRHFIVKLVTQRHDLLTLSLAPLRDRYIQDQSWVGSHLRLLKDRVVTPSLGVYIERKFSDWLACTGIKVWVAQLFSDSSVNKTGGNPSWNWDVYYIHSKDSFLVIRLKDGQVCREIPNSHSLTHSITHKLRRTDVH